MGREGEDQATEKGKPSSGKEHLNHLLKDVGRVVEDVRHLVEAGIDEKPLKKHEEAFRRGLGKVRDALKKAESKIAGEEARKGPEGTRAEERPPRTKWSVGEHDLTDTLETLGKGLDDLGAFLLDLRGALKPKEEGGLRGALGKARRMVSRNGKQRAATRVLCDGTDEALANWRLVGSGSVKRDGDTLRLDAGSELGLLYYPTAKFDDFRLRMQFRPEPGALMGPALRFRDPEQPVPDRNNPNVTYPYDNAAYVATHTGFEVALGEKKAEVELGSLVGVPFGEGPGEQARPGKAKVKAGAWNDVEIEVTGQRFTVRLNGRETCRFTNVDSFRAKGSGADPQAGFIGILLRRGGMAVRGVEIEPAQQPEEKPAERAEARGEQPGEREA